MSNRFSSVYSEGISRDTYVDALTEFGKSLVTPNARFDQYLRGDDDAITEKEKHGYQLFKDLGCISCHQGINIGGNLFQKLGIFYNYFASRGNIQHADYGRMNVTEKQSDMHVFKVPSLRNVEVTAPYLHDGTAETLEDVVVIMGRTQLGRNIRSTEVDLIVAFLKTLTGEYKNKLLGEKHS
jgi:cytochrome c peroxidase